ncbi:hypothetical protein Tco_0065862 [Tanacetum coccineum]
MIRYHRVLKVILTRKRMIITTLRLKDDPIPEYERLTFDIKPDVPVINNVDELNEDECFDSGGGTDNANIIRKRPKPDKHGHGNGKSAQEPEVSNKSYPIWEVIQNGNGLVSITTDTQGQIKVMPPRTAEEILARERERKARTTLLMDLPEDHLTKFHKMTDAKEMWDAIKSRFGGNDESKKMQNWPQLDHEDLEQLDEFDLEEMDLKWQVAMISMRMKKFYKKTDLVTIDGEGADWTSHSEEEEDYALMACSSSGSDTEVTFCSKECKESYAKLKKLYDAQREQLGDASIEIQAYTQALKKVEAQLVAHQQGQLWYEEKIRFMKIDLDDKTDVLTYHKKLLAEAEKEKEDLKAKIEKWHNSSKNLSILLNSQMSANDKFGLGYGDYRYDGILSYENEVLQSVFMNKESDLENQPLYDRFVTAEGMHVVPPPMTGNYMPSGPDIEIDYSQFTYGPKQSQASESETQTSDFDTCDSNCSDETHESLPEPAVNEPKVVSQPKVWSDAPIIEEYESDSEDEHVSLPTEEQETPSFANKQVKTPRETVKNQFTHSKNPKVDKKGLGYGFTTKACFVCGSLSHLIRDCDFHEKRMAKQAELNNRMRKKSSQREIRPIWNNVQRMNHRNQFVPKAVLTRTGKIPVNTARASGTNTVNTARHNVNRQAVPTNAANIVNTVKPIVNNARPKSDFHKSVSPFRKKPFNRTTTLRTNFSKQKVNTAEVNAVSVVGGKRATVVKPSAGLSTKSSTKQKVKKLAEEEATKAALSNEYDFIQARLNADKILAEKLQEKEREMYTIEQRAKLLHDTIVAQRRFLAQQRSKAIIIKLVRKLAYGNQMMTI